MLRLNLYRLLTLKYSQKVGTVIQKMKMRQTLTLERFAATVSPDVIANLNGKLLYYAVSFDPLGPVYAVAPEAVRPD
jgi:hypothetical protein